MNLRNLIMADMATPVDILIDQEKISAVCPSGKSPEPLQPAPSGVSLSLAGAIAFPGLINSHDHLDFNLFPPLGKGGYTNYSAWGKDIHTRNEAEISAVLKIPLALRTQWGLYKNLLGGVTTVVNHGERLVIDGSGALISVLQNAHSLHSVAFEKNWKWKVNWPRAAKPMVIHVGEGTDAAAGREIDTLIKWNLFKKSLIGIHGVAMNEQQAKSFTALVWCPVSNYFLLDRTARIDRLKKELPILFGTDSTLTAGWNIWDHIRLARQVGHLTDKELFDSLTTTPARIWGLQHTGRIIPGQYADLVIARPRIDTPGPKAPKAPDKIGLDAFYSVNPEQLLLVIHHGQIRLFDASLHDSLASAGMETGIYQPVVVKGRPKYVQGDLHGLVKKIREFYPAASFPFQTSG
jgi:cytosine/adenosine deaminase-related metal-dependent hydrolase